LWAKSKDRLTAYSESYISEYREAETGFLLLEGDWRVVLDSTCLSFQRVPRPFPWSDNNSLLSVTELKNAWSSSPEFPIHFQGLRLNTCITLTYDKALRERPAADYIRASYLKPKDEDTPRKLATATQPQFPGTVISRARILMT
jgi:hypothetical protein